jgi:hypothetical protein
VQPLYAEQDGHLHRSPSIAGPRDTTDCGLTDDPCRGVRFARGLRARGPRQLRCRDATLRGHWQDNESSGHREKQRY